jgi:protein-L-isoaspartate(D-aspartate) O-methyltransferase
LKAEKIIMSYKTYFYISLGLSFGILTGACAENGPTVTTEQALTEQRDYLVRQVEQHVHETAAWLGRKTLDPRVIAALAATPRHEFVPPALIDRAYEDRPLPIGADQTISQPYIVAIMTELLELDEDCNVLDIGTGSGYQAAILAELCSRVWSIEIIPSLGLAAVERLARLGYTNIEVRIGDGYSGWPEQAPFDGIIVAATGDEIPPPLLAQLKPGGRIIMPLRNRAGAETLVVAYKERDGRISTTDILPVRFVPLTRGSDKNDIGSD